MKKFRFRKFQVYRDCLQFRRSLKDIIKRFFPKGEEYLLKDQVIRAMNSVVLNIAEGADRSTDKDFANFLNKSHASLNEVVSCFDIALMDKYISAKVHSGVLIDAESLANQLTAFRRRLLTSNTSNN
jgi:four helix bundle protein